LLLYEVSINVILIHTEFRESLWRVCLVFRNMCTHSVSNCNIHFLSCFSYF